MILLQCQLFIPIIQCSLIYLNNSNLNAVISFDSNKKKNPIQFGLCQIDVWNCSFVRRSKTPILVRMAKPYERTRGISASSKLISSPGMYFVKSERIVKCLLVQSRSLRRGRSFFLSQEDERRLAWTSLPSVRPWRCLTWVSRLSLVVVGACPLCSCLHESR